MIGIESGNEISPPMVCVALTSNGVCSSTSYLSHCLLVFCRSVFVEHFEMLLHQRFAGVEFWAVSGLHSSTKYFSHCSLNP